MGQQIASCSNLTRPTQEIKLRRNEPQSMNLSPSPPNETLMGQKSLGIGANAHEIKAHSTMGTRRMQASGES
jgi:hypothetical protein